MAKASASLAPARESRQAGASNKDFAAASLAALVHLAAGKALAPNGVEMAEPIDPTPLWLHAFQNGLTKPGRMRQWYPILRPVHLRPGAVGQQRN